MLHKELRPEEVKKVMEIRTSWHTKGWQEGWQRGLEEGLQQGLEVGRREKAQETLSLEELDELAEKIFEVTSESDLKKLLSVEH